MTDNRSTRWLLDLRAPELDLAAAGGKGANLGLLLRAGFNVPDGFVVSTQAYRHFVELNQLDAAIASALTAVDPDSPDELELASQQIRQHFAQADLPADLGKAIDQAYAAIGEPPVAVRSSATAEDLPEASFAGQQDTLLNIVGSDELKRAVVHCWSSLWTARAIAYRARHGYGTQGLALAVVVQRMVDSQVSGVLFSANPLTGRRDQTVIDATLGLGEALVSGQVEPDHYVLSGDGRLVERFIGAKATRIHPQAGGGVAHVEAEGPRQSSLGDGELRALWQLGGQVEAELGLPQDIEWALADNQLYLLQSRPITTLFPLPDGLPAEPLHALFSFGAVQGLLDPITPLGRDVIRTAAAGAAGIFGLRQSVEDHSILVEAGQRLWIDISSMIGNTIGRRLTKGALAYVEPASRAVLVGLLDGDEFGRARQPRLVTVLRVLRPVPGVALGMLRTILWPDRQRKVFLEWIERWLASVDSDLAQANSFEDQARLLQSVARLGIAGLVPGFVPRFGPSMMGYNLLIHLSASLPPGAVEPPIDTRAMLRGLPHNVTTQMDLALWRTAQVIGADPAARQAVLEDELPELVAGWQHGRLPQVAQRELSAFLDRYGMRGLGEIDIGRPRWREDPTPLLQALRSYLLIEDPASAPDRVYQRGRLAAEAELERLVGALRKTPGGRLKAGLAHWASRRMRELMGLRESPKFGIIRLFWPFRQALLAEGAARVEAGQLEQADDLFYLTLREILALAQGDPSDWRGIIDQRRQAVKRERGRRRVPRMLLSDGRTFYEGLAGKAGEGAEQISGSPVSPGVVEGSVRVVLDPRGAALEPGEILVCPGTDPSWTPLFLVAGGLIMEVGGMMTHGAVVAREYGIPAVVGVHDATQRLATGQRVRVDGSTGQVALLGGRKVDDG